MTNKTWFSVCCAIAFIAFAPGPAVPESKAAQEQAADKFLVVDCLLPGRVRRLGRHATFMTARRAVRTTASDCEIRGGEYTAFDRANYATALKIWMPLARDGDPAAQNYVGEIYEKGLGVEPQYDLAAEWYRKAAEQGYAPAQINLGALYEQGLGVPQDRVVAVDWFRRASGLGQSGIPYVPAGVVEELEQLRGERDVLGAELERYSALLEERERELESLRDTTRQTRGEADNIRAQLEVLSAATDRDDGKIRALEQDLAARESEIAERNERIASLGGELANLRLEVEDLRATPEPVQLAAAPSIEIIEPPLEPVRAAGPMVIEVGTAPERVIVGRVDAPAGLVTLIVNDIEQETRDGLFRAAVSVTHPETPVSIVAIDAAGRRAAVHFALRPDAPSPASPAAADVAAAVAVALPGDFDLGTYHALVIGNNDYRHLPRLETAVNDARTLDELLRSRYGFRTTLLLDADRYAILAALNRLREELDENDNLLIYYAGHGEIDRVNDRGHWLPIDAEPHSTANWISNIQITDLLNAMTARQVLVVVDSCYSGTLTRAALARLDAGMSETARSNWIKMMSEKRARVVMTSGGVQPVMDRGGRGDHSVFASAFLDVLRENDEILEGQRIYLSVAERLAQTVAAEFGQTPQYAPIKYCGHETGDFFFVPAS